MMHTFQFGCYQPSWLSLDRDALALGDDLGDVCQSLGSHNLKMKACAAKALAMLVATARLGCFGQELNCAGVKQCCKV